MQNMNPKQKLKSTSLLSQSDSETRNSFSIDSARAIARTLIGGRCIFIYSGFARLISFEINFISKETSRAEPEYMSIHPPPPN